MLNFREVQVNSVVGYCINQYWEKEVEVNDIKITLHYWMRKEGCLGFTGREGILMVTGVKDGKKRRISSIWTTSLGEKHCINSIVSKFKEIEELIP